MSTAASARRRTIVEMVTSEGFMSTAELAARLSVSEMSIRRDAEALSGLGEVARIRGGLVPVLPTAKNNDSQASQRQRRIAEAATDLLAPDAVIIIDAGTTALAFARELPDGFRGTVITHSLPVLSLLEEREQVTTIGLGGELYRQSRAFIGNAALTALQHLRATTFFMGTASVRGDGTFAARDVERNLKRAMIEVADNVVVLAESTKFESAAPVFIAPWSEQFSIVTDEQPLTPMRSELAGHGVKVYAH